MGERHRIIRLVRWQQQAESERRTTGIDFAKTFSAASPEGDGIDTFARSIV